ncbi:DUF3577 domain-containing protein [Entomomonas sp. E2T0]|uniref:DUF3577 domain-containing protein n=1 Tax=Entomomonas sp. E2T0 TaxID=2930213 RepID=UPI0022281987|nr:DUF3577 domain-containing protein [Entomomonas sp. E2T0]UYZ83098.1 DUF3577 domain-containing protein [Entomomonas sp. E2T0]
MTNTNQANTNTQSTGGLVSEGIGYVNNIEWRTKDDGQSFLVCKVAAITGSQQYVFTSCVVNGEQAKQLIAQCIEASQAENKILIRFKMSINNLYAYQTNEGDLGAVINGSLFDVSYIKIENQVVYQRSAENGTQQPEQAPAPQPNANKGNKSYQAKGKGQQKGKNNQASNKQPAKPQQQGNASYGSFGQFA